MAAAALIACMAALAVEPTAHAATPFSARFPASAKAGARIAVTVSARHAAPGTRLRLQRHAGGWRTVARAGAGNKRRVTLITIAPRAATSVRLRVAAVLRARVIWRSRTAVVAVRVARRRVCPVGQAGTPPTCHALACPDGATGTPPLCLDPPDRPICAPNQTGTPPDCHDSLNRDTIEAPTAHTGAASAVTQTSATINGTVDPSGTSATYHFDWGTTTSYGNRTAESGPLTGPSAVSVSGAITGLAAATSYHFRLVATSCGGCARGTSYGADAVFSTPGAYQNPVYSAAAAPDPFVLDNHGAHSDYWAFTTGDRFPVLHSPDLIHWTSTGTAFASKPAWVLQSGDWHPWAPSVIEMPTACPHAASGPCYVMYYVGLSSQYNFNCIGVAVATAPAGPYTDLGPLGPSNAAGVPIGCGDDTGMGNIDPSPFTDANGQAYLYVSTSNACAGGTCQRQPTISVIPLTSDRLHASATRIALFPGTTGTWEAAGLTVPVVENPFAILHGGTYYVLYSGGSYTGAYGMGYATAPTPTGPFTKAATNPILAQTATVYSPGGGDLPVTGPHGGTWMAYHGREGSYSAMRTLRIDPFSWTAPGSGEPDVPTISGPTDTPQPVAP